jgi:uncharacterized protein (TIGR02246 family)
MWKPIRAFLLLLMVGGTAAGCAGISESRPGVTASAVRPLQSAAVAQSEIDAARRQFTEAYQKADATALSELFAPDASFTGTISPVWRQGREAIRENWARVFREFPISQITFTGPSVRFYNTTPTGDITENTLAVETGLFEMRMVNTAGQTVLTPGKYSLIRVLRNGRWEIVNYHTSPIPGQR